MADKIIYLWKNNPTARSDTFARCKRTRIGNEVVVAHDGVEALDYLLGTKSHRGNNLKPLHKLCCSI